jgi:phage terminase large subunit-like protein
MVVDMGRREVILPYSPRAAFDMPFHKPQGLSVWSCLVAHRRAGKTVAAINDLIKRAITEGNRSAQYAYIAPFRSQAKRVAWDYLKFYAAPVTKATNESDLMVELLNGAKIMLFGADNADAMRGLGFNGVYLDEYGDFKPSVWGNVIALRCLTGLGGRCLGERQRAKTSSTTSTRSAK